MDDEITKTVKSIKRINRIEKLIFGALLFLVAFYVKNIALEAVLIVLTVLAFIVVYPLVQNQKINHILIFELDPLKYHAVVRALSKNRASDSVNMNTAYYIGDYANAAAFAKRGIEKNQKAFLPSYYYTLASCYFEADAFEELPGLIEKLRSFKAKKKSVFKLTTLPIVDYFESFINGDYEACKRIEKLKDVEHVKKSTSFYCKIDYYTALAYYYNGEKGRAEELFQGLLTSCPKLGYSRLAQCFLNAINRGEYLDYASLKVNFEEVQIPPQEVKQKSSLKKNMILRLGVIAILIGLTVISSSNIPGNSKGDVYTVLNSVIRTKSIVEIVEIDDRGDALCVFISKDDMFRVAYLQCRGKDAYSYGIDTDSDINSLHYICAGSSDLKIVFSVTDDVQKTQNAVICRELDGVSNNSQTTYFCIYKIEHYNCVGYTAGIAFENDIY